MYELEQLKVSYDADFIKNCSVSPLARLKAVVNFEVIMLEFLVSTKCVSQYRPVVYVWGVCV